MKFRKMRIAWSAGCGIVAVLLFVLWARSYWRWDEFYAPVGSLRTVTLSSRGGHLVLSTYIPSELPGGEGTTNDWDWWSFYPDTENSEPMFGVNSDQYQSSINFPHWLPAFSFAAIALAPAIQWRFSLRTLLIATTLIAVLLGAVIWAVGIVPP